MASCVRGHVRGPHSRLEHAHRRARIRVRDFAVPVPFVAAPAAKDACRHSHLRPDYRRRAKDPMLPKWDIPEQLIWCKEEPLLDMTCNAHQGVSGTGRS